jgi:hypothetical protein
MKSAATPGSVSPEIAMLCLQWNLAANDPNVQDILGRLDRTWKQWTDEQRRTLEAAVEAIVRAEQLKKRSKSSSKQLTKRELLRICKLGSAALVLADGISSAFPPPWKWNQRGIEALVAELVGCALELKIVTELSGPKGRASTAGFLIAWAKSTTPPNTGRITWPLIAELVWLCSGMRRQPLDESAIRRYFQLRKKPAADFARSHWMKYSAVLDRVTKLPIKIPKNRFSFAFTHLMGLAVKPPRRRT